MSDTINKAPSGRVRRNSMDAQNKLRVQGKDPNYEYRFVNDFEGRIEQLQEQGYEIVDQKNVKVGDKRVEANRGEGSKTHLNVGQGTKAFLMRIKKEWYQEDQLAKANNIAEQEKAIKKPAGTYGEVKLS
ncbi:MAG: hypothetical protein ACRDBG_12975 [Waterburya sp.]